ncbi:MAG: iron-containing alcohol dehydrogenase [Actinomycetales bacterium]
MTSRRARPTPGSRSLHLVSGCGSSAPATVPGGAGASSAGDEAVASAHRAPVKFHAPEILFGVGALAEAGYAARRLGAVRPLVVTDEGLLTTPWVDELLTHLRQAGLHPSVWAGLTPNPKDHEVRAGTRHYREHGADVLIALGGGSCIDAAKAIAIMAADGGDILGCDGIDQVGGPIPPMLMIPSTAGTGADVSQFCIVTDTARAVKMSIMGRALVPDISLTDPRLLTTMSPELNAATGFDALTHAIEAYVSLAHNPLADVHALNAFRLIAENLRPSLTSSTGLDGHAAMAQASLEAGLAFSNAILGAVHAMAHQVGGLTDAPHGMVNAVLLPHVVRYNAGVDEAGQDNTACTARYADLAAAAGLVGRSPQAAADRLADWAGTLAADLDLPTRLACFGVRPGDVDDLADTTLTDACLATNPRPAGHREIAGLLREAL